MTHIFLFHAELGQTSLVKYFVTLWRTCAGNGFVHFCFDWIDHSVFKFNSSISLEFFNYHYYYLWSGCTSSSSLSINAESSASWTTNVFDECSIEFNYAAYYLLSWISLKRNRSLRVLLGPATLLSWLWLWRPDGPETRITVNDL